MNLNAILGWAEQKKGWILAELVALAGAVLSGFDVTGLLTYLGLPAPTATEIHWIMGVSVAILWLAGKPISKNPLPLAAVNQGLRKVPVVLFGALLVAATTFSACTSNVPPTLTPAQQAQYQAAVTADQVSHAIAALRATAVQLQAEGNLDTHVTAEIVRFDLASQQTLAAAPAGWQATVAAGWQGLKAALPTSLVNNPSVSTSITTLDALLGYLAGR